MSKRSSTVWSALCGGMTRVFSVVEDSPLGQGLSSYETESEAHVFSRPVSAPRLFLAKLLAEARIPKAFSGIFSFLTHVRVSMYGLTGLAYSVFGILLYSLLRFAAPIREVGIIYPVDYLWTFGFIGILSVPLLFSKKKAGQALLRGRLTGPLFSRLLGIPDHTTDVRADHGLGGAKGILPGLFLGLSGAALTVYLHPAVLPACFVLVCLLGGIFAWPEMGVALCVMTLPLLWARADLLFLPLVLIPVTWFSFFAKWLLMRRRWRVGPLEMIMGLFCLSLLLGGMTGSFVGADSVCGGLVYALLFSVYFLITNLIHTKKAVLNCIFGLSLTLIMTLPALYGAELYARVSAGELSWLAGSIGGDALLRFATAVTQGLGRLWQPAGVCLVLTLLPILMCHFSQQRRVLGKCLSVLGILLCFGGLILAGAWDALLPAVLVTVAFCLLCSPGAAAVTLVLLPAVVSGVALLWHFFGAFFGEELTALVLQRENSQQIWRGLWEMLLEHPAGIGLGDKAFAEIFPAYVPENTPVPAAGEMGFVGQIMAGLGFPGLLLLLLTLFFVLQKSFTCLRATGNRRDRAVVTSTMLACVSLCIYGSMSPWATGIPVCFTWVILMGLCNAYRNAVLTESAVLSVVDAPTPESTDRVYRM